MTYHDETAKREGWAVFDCDSGYLRIMRLDCPQDAFDDLPADPMFPSDDEAIAFVQAKADAGSEMHRAAIALHMTEQDWHKEPQK